MCMGAFFKSHKDTPRDSDMFGSLVIVFPIPHEGGSLVLRHSDQEWTFDSAALTKKQTTPSIEYIAFYSDVDHEVTVVESGYRVTLTYNLHFGTEARSNLSAVSPVAPDERIFRETLTAALDNPSFLPTGGYLGFGMSFKYPFSGKSSGWARVDLGIKLKGSDALIYRVCGEASLETSLKANYEADDGLEVLVPLNNLLGDNLVENGVAMALCEDHDGLVVHEFGTPLPTFGYSRRPIPDEQVAHLAWVTPQTSYNNFASTYAAYGNEPTSETAYADLCIVVKVGPYGERATGLPGKSLRETLQERLDNLLERFESFKRTQGITLAENDNAPIASASGSSSPSASV
ncbi:hypothetical protein H0H93_004611 [Arthromyces matolae]|nr:hypothetical protein H0H93_004611 [Arthromyces matolae]